MQTLRPPALQAVLLDLPGLLFFSTYTLLVLFWAEIYHQARSLSTRALRPAFLAFNAVVYAAEVALWLVAGLVHGDNVAGLVRVISCAFLAAVSLAAAAGFLIYGGRLFLMLRRCVPADMHSACSCWGDAPYGYAGFRACECTMITTHWLAARAQVCLLLSGFTVVASPRGATWPVTAF